MSINAKKNAKKIAVETVKTLCEELLDKAKKSVLTESEITALITNAIKNAYDQANLDGKKLLYREFSLLLHSDRLKTINIELYEFLNSQKLEDVPQKVLGEINDPYKKELAGNESFWIDIKQPSKVLITLLTRVVNNPFWNNISRYAPPFNWLGYGVAIGTLVSLVVVGFVALIFLTVLASAVHVGNSIVNMMANLVTNHFYDKLINEYKEEFVAEYKGAYVKKLKEALSQEDLEKVNYFSDDDFLNFIVEAQARQIYGLTPSTQDRKTILDQHNKAIFDSIPVADLKRSELLLRAVYQVVTRPLDQIEGNKWINLLIARPFLVLATPFVLTAVAVGDLAKIAVNGAWNAGLFLGLSIYYATLLLINVPLKIYDSLYDFFVGKESRMFFKAPKANKTNEFENNRNPMFRLAITDGSENTIKAGKIDDSEPGHFPGLLKKPADVKIDDVRLDAGETIQPGF